MRNVLRTLFISLAISSISLFGADNSIGTWKWNTAKSKSTPTPANPIANLTITYTPVDGGAKSVVTGKRKDGTVIDSTATIKYDGKEYPVAGAPWDVTSVKQIDANTFTFESRKKDGKYHVTGKTVISKDGKTMTTTTKGTNTEGKPSTSKIIWDKA
jgi:hypothetical protein